MTVSAYRNVDSEWDLPFPLSYRGGQLVVEYANVCFRSQETVGQWVGASGSEYNRRCRNNMISPKGTQCENSMRRSEWKWRVSAGRPRLKLDVARIAPAPGGATGESLVFSLFETA
jgi:hypothetical protein